MKGIIYNPQRIIFIFLILFGWFSNVKAESIQVISRNNGQKIGEIAAVEAGRYDFISITEFADQFSISYKQDDILKHIQLILPRTTVTIAAVNPYILVGGQTRQLPIQVLFRNGVYYAPLKFFLRAIHDVLPIDIEYNEKDKNLYVVNDSENITGVIIEEKGNGTLLRIKLTEKFSDSNVFTSESNGWLYVDFYGGRVDTLKYFSVKQQGRLVKQIHPIQLSSETARISFRVGGDVKDRQVILKEDPPEAIVSIRTREDISRDLLNELEKEREKWRIDVIVIDPGHGGKDPGAVGNGRLYEKKVTLDIAKELKKEIENKLDVKVVMTRDKDVFIPLKERTRIANKEGGKLFISIHVDSNPHKGLRGHTVYFLGPAKTEQARKAAQFENSVIQFEDSQAHYKNFSDASFILAANAQNSYNKESQDLAAIINEQISNKCKSNGHGVRQAGFYVLYGASMPNILVESAFISNRSDEKKLRSKSYRKSLAQAICNGIIDFKKKYEE